MDKKDQEIQERILNQLSNGHTPADLMSEEERAYYQLFGALQEEPSVKIPIDFSKKVTMVAFKRVKIRVFLKNTFYITLLSLFVLGVTMAALLYISNELVSELWMILISFKVPIIFGVAVFMAIQLVDKIFMPLKPDPSY